MAATMSIQYAMSSTSVIPWRAPCPELCQA